MNFTPMIQRVSMAIVALGLLTLGRPVAAAEPADFLSRGLTTVTEAADEGELGVLEAVSVGESEVILFEESEPAMIFGEFEGTLRSNLIGGGIAGMGEATQNYANGSITFAFIDEVGPDGRLHGAWRITDATGAFEGAQGSGLLTGVFIPPMELDDPNMFTFELSGKIFLP